MSEHADVSGSGKTVGFDPYHKWLGIHPSEQPPNFYRLLGIAKFESDADVISNAADARMAHVKTFQAGANSNHSQQILNELARAKLCLLIPSKKAEYDRRLRERLAIATSAPDQDDCYELRRTDVDECPAASMDFLAEHDFKPKTTIVKSRRRKITSDKITAMCVLGATTVALALIIVLYLNENRGENTAPDRTNSRAAAPREKRAKTPATSSNNDKSYASPKNSGNRSQNHSSPESRPQYARPSPAFGSARNNNGVASIPGRDSIATHRQSPKANTNGTPPLNKPDLIEKIKPSIVVIHTDKAVGSGFVIDDDGLIVTNYHVIEDASKATATFFNGTTVEIAGYVAVDKGCDLAILRANMSGKLRLLSLPLRSELPRTGESVLAFGSPKGFNFTTSDGIISAIRSGNEIRDIWKDTLNADVYGVMGYDVDSTWIQTTAAISPGNSGGPLITMDGKVVGVNTWCRLKAQNLNFAISSTSIILLAKNISAVVQPLYSLPRSESSSSAIGGNKNEKTIPPLRIDLTLPSGAVLCESMLEVPDRWQRKLFPEKTIIYVATWPNGDVRGIFSLDHAKLDGYAIALHETGHLQTLAFYKRANLDGRMIQWKETGERLFYAEHKCGNKHGLFCLFRDDLPWLIQEWEKKTIQNEYIVEYLAEGPRLTPVDQMNDRQREEYGRAVSELAVLESTLKKNEAQLKQDLAKWYRQEDKKLKRQRMPQQTRAKRNRMLDDIYKRNKAKHEAFLRKRATIEGRQPTI